MKSWLLPVGVGTAALALALWTPRQELLSPRFGLPALPGPGGTFTLEVRTALPWTFRPGQPPAPRDAHGSPLQLLATRWRGNRASLTFRAAEVPDLAVRPTTWDPKGTVRMVQIGDLPSLGDEARMAQFVSEMQLLGPDLILATGDISYVYTQPWYDFLRRSLAATGAPVVAVTGNHERSDWPLWLRNFGTKDDHRVDVGTFTILSLDTKHGRDGLTPSQMRWFEGELKAARALGHTILVQAHHPIWPAGAGGKGEGHGSGGNIQVYQKRFVQLCRTYAVEAVFSGHWHQDAVFDQEGRLRDDTADFPGTKFLTVTSLGHAERLVSRWPHKNIGYRVLEFQAGRLVRFTEDPQGTDARVPIWSQSLGRITREDRRGPDGRWTGTTITNGSSHPLRGTLGLDLTPDLSLTHRLDVPPHSTRTFGQEAPR